MLYFGLSTEHLKKWFQKSHRILPTICHQFPDGEQCFSVPESVKGHHVFLIHSLSPHNYMELFTQVATLQKHEALVHLIMPYAAYTRSLNIPIFPRFINALNLESLTLLDVHTPELLDMISIPTTHLSAMDMFKDHILEKFSKEHALIVSPDRGGKNRVDYLCQVTGFSKVYMDKQRINGQIHSQLEQGSVSGKVCVLVDDVIDSGQTILKAACVLREKGAREVHVYATHGVFSTLPFSSIEWQNLNSITVTDSCPPVVGVNILSISPLLEHIERRLFFEYNVFKKAQQSQWF